METKQNKQLTELSDEELKQVTGGAGDKPDAADGDPAAGIGGSIAHAELLRKDGRIWIPKKLEDAKA